MKLLKILLVGLVFLVNLAIVPPSWADAPNLTNTPDYTEVTQALNNLLQAKNNPDSGYTPEKFQQELGDLQLQKYILETARNWGQCRNETGRTLAVYAHKGKKSQASQLYYLGDGNITEDEWSCDGVYLPSGIKVAGLNSGDTQVQELTEPIALKIVSGTQLVATANPETGAIEFNVSPAKVFKSGEGNLSSPNLTSADIAAQAPTAPIED